MVKYILVGSDKSIPTAMKAADAIMPLIPNCSLNPLDMISVWPVTIRHKPSTIDVLSTLIIVTCDIMPPLVMVPV
jgi:hypothetical protein